MINSKSPPLTAAMFSPPSVPVDGRTTLIFNALGAVAVTLATLLLAGVTAHWALTSAQDVSAVMGFAPDVMPDLPIWMRLGALLLSLAAVAPLAWGLIRLRVCFSEFALGRPFAARGIAGLRDFAVGMGISVLAKPISFTLMVLLLTANAPAGQKQLAIRLDSDVVIMALFAATIAALGWAMQKAAAIAEENSQFV